MSTAEVRSSVQMGHPTTSGNAMTPRAFYPLRVTLLSGLVLLGAGCSSALSARTDLPESRVQVATPVRDRGLELTTLRVELAATRIAAAKKDAEILELRDLVQQLRLENAESRQAFLDLRDQVEQRQRDQEKVRGEQERQANAYTTHDLNVLKETVVTLAQALGQLKQELTNPVTKELLTPRNPGSSKSRESGLDVPRSNSPQRIPAARQNLLPSSAVSPMALTVTAGGVPDAFSTMTVQPGDTLASLAKRHRTTVEVLRKMNALTGDALIVGRELVLPTSQQP